MKPTFSSSILRWIAFAAVMINGFFPTLWIFLTAFKSEAELVRTPITWLPHQPTLDNFVRAFQQQPLLLFLGNSFAVALLSTALAIFVATCAAYVFARLELRSRGLILAILVGTA